LWVVRQKGLRESEETRKGNLSLKGQNRGKLEGQSGSKKLGEGCGDISEERWQRKKRKKGQRGAKGNELPWEAFQEGR